MSEYYNTFGQEKNTHNTKRQPQRGQPNDEKSCFALIIKSINY